MDDDEFIEQLLRRRLHENEQTEQDFRDYGFAAFDVATGKRVDPRRIRAMEGDEFEGLGFNPSEFFNALRKSAWVKTGAVMFGQAQTAYYKTLKEDMPEDQAYALLAHTTEQIIRGLAVSVGPVSEVLLKAAAMSEFFDSLRPEKSDKQVPGE